MRDPEALSVPFIGDETLRNAMKKELKIYNCAYFLSKKYPHYNGWYYYPVTNSWGKADRDNYQKACEIAEKYRNIWGAIMEQKTITGEGYIILRGELVEKIQAAAKEADKCVESYLYSLLRSE